MVAPSLPDGLPEPDWSDQEFGIALYRGDCLDILPRIHKVNALITDPPYMINVRSDHVGKINPWADMCNGAFWYSAWYRESKRLLRYGGCQWTFLNWRTLPTVQKASFDCGWKIESLLVWDKECIGPGGARGLRPCYELVALMVEGEWALKDRGIPDIRRVKWSSTKPTGHPAEKPLKLLEWIVKISDPKIVMDPFMGSGTTGVACVNLGRAFIGVESDESTFEMAANRIRTAIIEQQGGQLFASHRPKELFTESETQINGSGGD